jgi:hypothetical protein
MNSPILHTIYNRAPQSCRGAGRCEDLQICNDGSPSNGEEGMVDLQASYGQFGTNPQHGLKRQDCPRSRKIQI